MFGNLVCPVNWNVFNEDQKCHCYTDGPSYVMASYRIVAMTPYRNMKGLDRLYVRDE